MVVLVTGGAGFIGSHLVERLVADGHQVRVLDDLSTGSEANLARVTGAIELIRGDIRSAATVSSALSGVQAVFHLAAIPSVARSWEDPVASLSVNGLGTATVAEAARGSRAATLVHASSSSVYGDQAGDLRSEDMAPNPMSPYAVGKLLAEKVALAHHGQGLKVTALRFFNVFGPRQDPVSPYSALIPALIAHSRSGTQATIYGDGLQSRDFTYVENVVAANLLAWRGAGGAAFNVGTGDSLTVLEVARRVSELDGRSLRFLHGPPRAGEVRGSRADLGRARAQLGYEPSVPFEEGLRRTYESFAQS